MNPATPKPPAGKRAMARHAPKVRRELKLTSAEDAVFTDVMAERDVDFHQALRIVLEPRRRRADKNRRRVMRDELGMIRGALAALLKTNDPDVIRTLVRDLYAKAALVERMLNELDQSLNHVG